MIDVTLPIHEGMVTFPGDPDVSVRSFSGIDKGDATNLRAISFGSHCGTHLDAPGHLFADGKTTGEIRLERLIGVVKVFLIKDRTSIKVAELEKMQIKKGENVFFKTRNSKLWNSKVFSPDFVFLETDAAAYLAGRKVNLVGIDYFSVEQFGNTSLAVHRVLLKNGIIIVEGLDLRKVPAGNYFMFCLPLKCDCDGAPARVLLVTEKDKNI